MRNQEPQQCQVHDDRHQYVPCCFYSAHGSRQGFIASEALRHVDLLESGQPVLQETRGFDEARAETFKLRSKEDSPDYRYMPDPNLPPLLLSPVRPSLLSHLSSTRP